MNHLHTSSPFLPLPAGKSKGLATRVQTRCFGSSSRACASTTRQWEPQPNFPWMPMGLKS